MNAPPKRREPVEHIILETRPPRWVALSMSGCGILTRALVGRHVARYRESESIALTFASTVVQEAGCSLSHDRLSTPQILIDAADARRFCANLQNMYLDLDEILRSRYVVNNQRVRTIVEIWTGLLARRGRFDC